CCSAVNRVSVNPVWFRRSFAQRARTRAEYGCKVVGVARDDERYAAAQETTSSRRSAHHAGRNLQLVHLGVRYRRCLANAVSVSPSMAPAKSSCAAFEN